MKKLTTTLVLCTLMVIQAVAQMNIWYDGKIVYQRDYTKVDSITFTLQDVNPPTPTTDVEDGMYIYGAATGFANPSVEGAEVCQMAIGVNGRTFSTREGMYEKYLVLEKDKDFFIVNKAGSNKTAYTASLSMMSLTTDDGKIDAYWGNVAAGNSAMKVEKTGLYHVVLELNLDGKLDNAGGAQLLVIPVEWGVRGFMNGWGWTKYDQISENGLAWTWNDVECPANKSSFQFANRQNWRVLLDDKEQVVVNIGLGEHMIPGGENIFIAERGVYSITLAYKMAKGDVAKSFSYSVTRTGDVSTKDYSNVELELVGSAIANQEGATADPSAWNWGNVYSLGKPTKDGNTYIWWHGNDKIKMIGGQRYKVRTKSFQGYDNIQAFDNGADIEVDKDKEVGIIVTLDATTGKMEVQEVNSTLVETMDITITGINIPAWKEVAMYAWNENGTLAGDWPGTKLNVKDGVVVYKFDNVVPPINVIFNNNGQGAQTEDITNITEDIDIDVSEHLKK